LPSEALFQLGSANFTAEGARQANALAEGLASFLPCHAAGGVPAPGSCVAPYPAFATVLIEGHTDTLPADNWRLSTDRARAMLELLLARAGTLRALRNGEDQPLIGIAGYGETRTLPGIPGTDARNRRIEIRFLLAQPDAGDLFVLQERLDRLRLALRGIGAVRQP
jgi:outer membrane protein OmpA-like peptidoglycan-associated protein